MPLVSTDKIITNRQLNFTLSPVDTHNAKSMPHKLQNYEIDGTWNQHQSIILDILLDNFFKAFYKNYNTAPHSWQSLKVIEALQRFENNIINPESVSSLSMSYRESYFKMTGDGLLVSLKEIYDSSESAQKKLTFDQFIDNNLQNSYEYKIMVKEIKKKLADFYSDVNFEFNLSNLFDEYPILRKYRYTLNSHLKNIENAKFKMTYKVKYMAKQPSFSDKGKLVQKGELIDLNYLMQDFQHVLKFDSDQQKLVLNFDTPLGKLVLHNLLIMDTDYCSIEAFNLSKNAYFIYKRFVLNKQAGKNKSKTIRLNFDELKAFLDLHWSNDRGIGAIIEKALNDLAGHALVSSWESGKSFGGQKTYLLKFGN
jgi:hypothetical protein